MKNLTLVVMAAGMGSRFGGLKQIEPVGPNGELILDYSVYDAKRYGFTKVVFVIREDIYDLFKEKIGDRVSKFIPVEYAFQSLNYKLDDSLIPQGRTKMWGTAHAVLAAENYVDGDFAVINADDFNSFETFQHFLDFHNTSSDEYEYLTVNYPFYVTASRHGSVKRGVCIIENGYLKETIETEIKSEQNQLIASPLDGTASFPISEKQPVSVNLFLFKRSFFGFLNRDWEQFIKNGLTDKNEFMLPVVLQNALKKKEIKVKTQTSDGIWLGMTYKEDVEDIKKSIEKLIEEGKYPSKLWD